MKVPLVLIIVLGGASAFLLPCSVRSNGAVRYTYLKSKSEWARDDGVHVRPGKTDDETAIRTTLAKMLMNPLSIDVQNFVCAEDEGKLIGFGQVISSCSCISCLPEMTPSLKLPPTVTGNWYGESFYPFSACRSHLIPTSQAE